MQDSKTAASPFDENFDKLTSKLMQDFHVPGLSVAVIDGDEVFSKGYGFADLPSTKATPETLYYIGSITKNIFATTLTKYIQTQKETEDKITLQTKLADLIRDDFVLEDRWASNHITFEDALCHRTGMARNNLILGGSIKTVKDVARALRHIPLSTEVRQQFDYCNIMFAVAQHAMEAKTKEALSDTMKKLVFEPLSMHDTYTAHEAALEGGHDEVRLYDGYEWYGEQTPNGKGRFVKQNHVDLACAGGAGFVISNVLDLAKYTKAQLGHGDLLSKEIRAEVSRPRIPTTKNIYGEEYAHYALGLDVRTYNGVEIIGHNGVSKGGHTGYTTLFNMVPALNFGVVALGNCSTSSMVAEILFHHLLDERLQLDAGKRFDFVEYYRKMRETITRKQTLDEATKEQYPSLIEKSIPLILPIADYEGSFRHPAYRSFTFKVKSGTEFSHGKQYLEAIVTDRTWPFILRLFHISGDYWLGYLLNGVEEREGQKILVIKAIARQGIDGTITEWGLEMEPNQVRKDWREKLFWFVREPATP